MGLERAARSCPLDAVPAWTDRMKLPPRFAERLRAPHDRALPLALDPGGLAAADGRFYPVVDGVPILIDEARSIFRLADYEAGLPTTMDMRGEEGALRRALDRLREGALGLSAEVSDFPPDAALAAIAAERPGGAVLVLGAGEAGLAQAHGLDLLFSDVAMGPLTQVVIDAHDIPFADASFDAVIAVAMLEHVLDPAACVAEMARVLKPGGLVYAVTPFCQQVHMGCYDFTRFTALGHRRLFRHFDAVREGIANGPGTTLSWAIEYWLTSFSDRPALRRLLGGAGRLIGWPIRATDRFAARSEGAWDGASAFYFYGRKADAPLDDMALLRLYRGRSAPRRGD
jgi:SAM-dependent methyltransferase